MSLRLARLQQVLVLAVLTAATAWWFASDDLGWWWPWRLAVLILILLPHATILTVEFAMLAKFGNSAPVLSPTTTQLIRAWLGEVISGVMVFGWRQPFRSNAVADHLCPNQHLGRRGVLLVHGFVCNRGLWTPWMRQLRRVDVPFLAVNLEPVFGSIDDYLPLIDAAVDRLRKVTGLPPVVVAHSMGGLATRAWLNAHRADHRVDAVITIATPHHGTWLARFGVTPNGFQMRCNSPWIAHLAEVETSARLARFICFYSHCDNIVFPAANGTLPGADNRHVPATAHVHMVRAPEVFAALLQRLNLACQAKQAEI